MRHHKQRGGILAGVLIVVLVLVALVGAGLILAGLYVAQNVKVTKKDGHGEQTTVETPFGTLRVRERTSLDPKRVGIPVYPGAVRTDTNKLASFEFDAGDTHKSFSIAAAEYTTPDPVEKVRDYYQAELPHWMLTEKRHGGWQLELSEGGFRKIIAVREEHGETHIGLASVGEDAAN